MNNARLFSFLIVMTVAGSGCSGEYSPTKTELREIVGSYWTCPEEYGQVFEMYSAPDDIPPDRLTVDMGGGPRAFDQMRGENPVQALVLLHDGGFRFQLAHQGTVGSAFDVVLVGRPPEKMTLFADGQLQRVCFRNTELLSETR